MENLRNNSESVNNGIDWQILTEDSINPEQEDTNVEKLKKGIKVVIGGPPHSGKSVFIEALNENLDRDNSFIISAAPDGEGPWLQKYYNNPEVAKYRSKGQFTPEYVEDRKKKIEDWEGPLLLVDVGGRTSAENAEMIQGATHAIILSSDLSKMQEWEDFFTENGLDVIAKLHSHYVGNKDLQLPSSSQMVASVHHLERGEPAVDRDSIRQTAGIIANLVDKNTAYQASHEQGFNPFIVNVSKEFDDYLLSKVSERIVKTPDGEEKLIRNKEILRSAIPEIYKLAERYAEQPAWLDGRISSWEAVALALGFKEASSPDIRLKGPDGFIKVQALEEQAIIDGKWWSHPEKQGIIGKNPVYLIHNTAHAANNPIKPTDLEEMTIPELPENAIVSISTQGPNWLKASIAMGYHDKVAAIATFHPAEGSTIAWAKDKSLLGTVIK